MIQSCKYCLSQKYSCPRCEGSVFVQTLTQRMPNFEFKSASIIICYNEKCENYGEFKIQTKDAIDDSKEFVCDECKDKGEDWINSNG